MVYFTYRINQMGERDDVYDMEERTMYRKWNAKIEIGLSKTKNEVTKCQRVTRN